jgi:hypothetical protein
MPRLSDDSSRKFSFNEACRPWATGDRVNVGRSFGAFYAPRCEKLPRPGAAMQRV